MRGRVREGQDAAWSRSTGGGGSGVVVGRCLARARAEEAWSAEGRMKRKSRRRKGEGRPPGILYTSASDGRCAAAPPRSATTAGARTLSARLGAGRRGLEATDERPPRTSSRSRQDLIGRDAVLDRPAQYRWLADRGGRGKRRGGVGARDGHAWQECRLGRCCCWGGRRRVGCEGGPAGMGRRDAAGKPTRISRSRGREGPECVRLARPEAGGGTTNRRFLLGCSSAPAGLAGESGVLGLTFCSGRERRGRLESAQRAREGAGGPRSWTDLH